MDEVRQTDNRAEMRQGDMAERATVYERDGIKRVSVADARAHLDEVMQLARESHEPIYVEDGTETLIKLVPDTVERAVDAVEPTWMTEWKRVQSLVRNQRREEPLVPSPEEVIRDDRENH